MPGLPDSLIDLLANRATDVAGRPDDADDGVTTLLTAADGQWAAVQLARSRLLRRLSEQPDNKTTKVGVELLTACLDQMTTPESPVGEQVAPFIYVPPREGRAVRLEAGRRFRIIDLEGGQVADLFAFSADDLSEYHSAEHTRVHVSRLFPRPGEHFVTNRRRPILLFETDDSPGVHDMLCAACDPIRYTTLGATGWHASCEENLQHSMASLGLLNVDVPQPINLFMNTPITDTDGTIGWYPTLTKPGDHVTMRAEIDLIVAVSSCPQDIVSINGGTPSALGIEIEPP